MGDLAGRHPPSGGSSSGLEEPVEGGPDLGDHVGGGGGASVLLESLLAALPGEGAGAEGGHKQRAGPAGRGLKGGPNPVRPACHPGTHAGKLEPEGL